MTEWNRVALMSIADMEKEGFQVTEWKGPRHDRFRLQRGTEDLLLKRTSSTISDPNQVTTARQRLLREVEFSCNFREAKSTFPVKTRKIIDSGIGLRGYFVGEYIPQDPLCDWEESSRPFKGPEALIMGLVLSALDSHETLELESKGPRPFPKVPLHISEVIRPIENRVEWTQAIRSGKVRQADIDTAKTRIEEHLPDAQKAMQNGHLFPERIFPMSSGGGVIVIGGDTADNRNLRFSDLFSVQSGAYFWSGSHEIALMIAKTFLISRGINDLDRVWPAMRAPLIRQAIINFASAEAHQGKRHQQGRKDYSPLARQLWYRAINDDRAYFLGQ